MFFRFLGFSICFDLARGICFDLGNSLKEEPPSLGMAVADWPSSPVVTSKSLKTSIQNGGRTIGEVGKDQIHPILL